jgi:hypothetical protein
LKKGAMNDALMTVIVLAFFLASWSAVRFVDRL